MRAVIFDAAVALLLLIAASIVEAKPISIRCWDEMGPTNPLIIDFQEHKLWWKLGVQYNIFYKNKLQISAYYVDNFSGVGKLFILNRASGAYKLVATATLIDPKEYVSNAKRALKIIVQTVHGHCDTSNI